MLENVLCNLYFWILSQNFTWVKVFAFKNTSVFKSTNYKVHFLISIHCCIVLTMHLQNLVTLWNNLMHTPAKSPIHTSITQLWGIWTGTFPSAWKEDEPKQSLTLFSNLQLQLGLKRGSRWETVISYFVSLQVGKSFQHWGGTASHGCGDGVRHESDTLSAVSDTDDKDWVPVPGHCLSAPQCALTLGMRRQRHMENGYPRAGIFNGPPSTMRPSAMSLWPPR